MSHLPMPMNAAHQHAANADDHIGNGLLIPAAEEHSKAAEAYLAAVERSNDESAKRTLRLLYNEHSRAEKELQRKIQKLKDEGKDPTLPQKAELPQFSPAHSHSHARLGMPRPIPSPPPQRTMSDSQNTVDESFMLLAGQRSDPGDAFNQFWNIMQGMLDNLSQPVAFATVPLGETEPNAAARTSPSLPKDPSFSSDTDSADEPIFSRFSRRIGFNREGKKAARESNPSKATSDTGEDSDEEFLDDEFLNDELSGSFFVIPSTGEPAPATLRKENVVLKLDLETTRKRLEATERVLQLRKEQDAQLRDSIFQATREAQRVMGASVIGHRAGGMDFSSLNMNGPAMPIPGITSAREAQYARRLKEVEEEMRLLRAENEKNKAVIVKFRERWDKLKESAKRKKEAKAAAEASSKMTNQRIVEEPEEEEEMDSVGR